MWIFLKKLWSYIYCKSDDTEDTIYFYKYPYESKVNFSKRLWIEKQIFKNAEQR